MRLGRTTFARIGIIIMCFCLIMPMLGIVTDSACVYGTTVPPAKTISHVNTGNQATDIVEIARTQIGYKENRVSDKVGDIYTAYGEYFNYRYEWCAVFVCWCGKKAGISNMTTLSKGFTTVADPAQFKGTYYARGKVTPQKGDLIFFDWDFSGNYDHVGFVDYVKNGTVYTIEGNDRYGKVASKSYSLTSSYIRGYKRPNYTNNPTFVEPKGTKTILDGRYHIVSALHNDYCLDVNGASKDNGANIQLYTSRMDPAQTWNVTYLGDGYYKITSWNSGKSLDVANSGKTNGTNAIQWQYNGSNNQKWVIRKNGDGSYSIVSKCNGLCLEVKGSTVAKGTNIQMWQDNGTTNHKFYFVEWAGETILSGRYHIVSDLDNDYCLDVNGASTNTGANVQLYTSRMNPKQTWNVQSMGNGFYKITSWNSNLSLDVHNSGKADGTNVQQWTDTGVNAQRWIIKRNPDGSFGIISKCNGLYLDVSGGKAANGNNIQMHTRNDWSYQKFYFVEWAGETISSGRYHIVSKLDEQKCLGVHGSSTNAGANVQIDSATSDPKQTWNVQSMGNGFYKITSWNSNLSLDVHNSGKADGTNVQQWTDTGVNAQRWIIRPNGDGTYNIISKCNGLCVEAAGKETENGTNIQMHLNNETAAQQWIFVPYTEPQDPSSGDNNSSLAGEDTTSIPVPDNKPISVSEQTVEQVKVNNTITKIDVAKIKTIGSTSKKQMTIEIPKVNGATNYILAYKTANAKNWKYAFTGGHNKYIIRGLKLNSVIQFKVAACSNGARGDWSNICYRYLMTVKSAKAKAEKKSITVTWKKDAKASGYQILYSTNKNMKDYKIASIKGANKTKKVIKGIKKGKTYYVRLRPIKKYKGKSYLGILAPTRSVKVK